MSAPIERPYATTDILSRTVLKLLQIVAQILTLRVLEPPLGLGGLRSTDTIHHRFI